MSKYEIPYISEELRGLVATRADYLYEYCLISETDWSLCYQVNHIITIKHGGITTADNLAYACAFYNLYKCSDVNKVEVKPSCLTRRSLKSCTLKLSRTIDVSLSQSPYHLSTHLIGDTVTPLPVFQLNIVNIELNSKFHSGAFNFIESNFRLFP